VPLSILPPSSTSSTMEFIENCHHLAHKNTDADSAILRAAERRNPKAVSVPGRTRRISRDNEFEPWDANHPVRQEFRRMLDPGILRNNDRKQAAKALRAWNLINDHSPRG
jgi:hypothetical protein